LGIFNCLIASKVVPPHKRPSAALYLKLYLNGFYFSFRLGGILHLALIERVYWQLFALSKSNIAGI